MTDLTNLLAPIRARVETYRMYGEGIAHIPAAAYKLLAALEGVVALHESISDPYLGAGHDYAYCDECSRLIEGYVRYPCPTVAAVVAALGEEA